MVGLDYGNGTAYAGLQMLEGAMPREAITTCAATASAAERFGALMRGEFERAYQAALSAQLLVRRIDNALDEQIERVLGLARTGQLLRLTVVRVEHHVCGAESLKLSEILPDLRQIALAWPPIPIR